MRITPTKKPSSFREWFAIKLVNIARWIYPDSDAVRAFWMQLIMDREIYGNAIVRIEPKRFISFPKGTEMNIVNEQGEMIKLKTKKKKGVKKSGKKESK